MGAAIEALSDGVKMLRRSPVVVGIGAATFLVGATLTIALNLVPFVGPLLSGVLVVPLMFGGMIGVCRAAASGDAGARDYLATLGEDGLSLIGAYTLLQLGMFGIAVLMGIVMVAITFLLLFLVPASGGAGTTGAAGPGIGFGLFGGLILLVYVGIVVAIAAVGVVVQFIDAAIVIDDESAVSAFFRSWELVRSGPLSVLGYTLVRGVIGNFAFVGPMLLFVVVGIGADALGIDPTVALVVGGVGSLVVAPVAFTYQMAYHTAYFGRRRAA